MPVQDDSELLEWLERLRNLNPDRFAELRAQIGQLAESEKAVTLLFSAVLCMLSNFEQLPSIVASA